MLRISLAVLAVTGGFLGVADPALAQRADAIRQFPLPKGASGPAGIVAGPQDKLWFTEPDASRIGAINARTHRIGERQVSPNSGSATGIIAASGRLWFTGEQIYTPNPAIPDTVLIMSSVAELDPVTHAITQFLAPTSDRLPGEAIALASDGDFWFTEEAGVELGIVNPRTHAGATFTLPPGGLTPQLGGIVAGPDGDLWITEDNFLANPIEPPDPGSAIVRLNPVTHALAEFPLPASAVGAGQITVGPDGNLWFIEGQMNGGDAIGMLHTRTRAITSFRLPVPTPAAGIATGPDGNIWFTELNPAKIGVLDPTTGAIRLFPIPYDQLDGSGSITTGPDGNMWFTESYEETAPGSIGVITVGSGPAQQATCNATAHAAATSTHRCRLAPLGRPVTFPPGAAIAHLTRGGRLYASGSATSPHGALRLDVVPQHPLVSGTYRLALTAAGHTRHETVTLS